MSTTALVRVAVLALAASSCAGPLASINQSRTLLSAPVELKWGPEDDREQLRVGAALERAAPGLSRWGGLPSPVTVTLAPSHEALVAAVHHQGYDWLRAWAKWDDIIVQSPRTWGATGASDGEVDELLLHELTHCLLFQHASAKEEFSRRQLPLWFREGMATTTANQGYRFPTLEDLSQWMAKHPELDAFTDGEQLSRDYFPYVYATAHHAFTFVLRRYSDAAIKRVMIALGEGRSFEEAFLDGVGVTVPVLKGDFVHYVVSGAFRRELTPPSP